MEKSFYSCSGLKSISSPSSVKTIDENAFQYCSNLGDVSFQEPSNLTTIESAAFDSCNLKSISIPSSVKTIGEGVFQDCLNLEDVYISSIID